MQWRSGRKVNHNIYLQKGSEPSDDDICIGHMHDADYAALAIKAVNLYLEATKEQADKYLRGMHD